jgi:hypothetical protein
VDLLFHSVDKQQSFYSAHDGSSQVVCDNIHSNIQPSWHTIVRNAVVDSREVEKERKRTIENFSLMNKKVIGE